MGLGGPSDTMLLSEACRLPIMVATSRLETGSADRLVDAMGAYSDLVSASGGQSRGEFARAVARWRRTFEPTVLECCDSLDAHLLWTGLARFPARSGSEHDQLLAESWDVATAGFLGRVLRVAWERLVWGDRAEAFVLLSALSTAGAAAELAEWAGWPDASPVGSFGYESLRNRVAFETAAGVAGEFSLDLLARTVAISLGETAAVVLGAVVSQDVSRGPDDGAFGELYLPVPGPLPTGRFYSLGLFTLELPPVPEVWRSAWELVASRIVSKLGGVDLGTRRRHWWGGLDPWQVGGGCSDQLARTLWRDWNGTWSELQETVGLVRAQGQPFREDGSYSMGKSK